MTTKSPKFIKVYDDLFDEELYPLNTHEILLYSKLLTISQASMRNDYTGKTKRGYVLPYVYLSISQIETLLKVSRPTAIKYLDNLEQLGLIIKERQYNNATKIYVFNLLNSRGEPMEWITSEETEQYYYDSYHDNF